MQRQDPQAQLQSDSVSELWRRAPAFRGLVYLAASISLVGAIALSLDYGSEGTAALSSPEALKSARQPGTTVTSKPQALPMPQPAVQSNKSEPASLPDQSPAVVAQVSASGAEEDAQLARCHPHLMPGSAAMPQIDVSRMADPSLGHIKVHFWVNGAGLVTREVLTATTYATTEERQAELNFTKGLTFTVPNTAACRVREMELVGDFFEMKGSTGQWATFVRLYPRLSFDTDGVVRSRE